MVSKQRKEKEYANSRRAQKVTDTDKIPLSTKEIEKLETQWKHSYFSMGNTWCG